MIIRHLCAVGAGPAIAAVFQGRILLTEAVKAELTMQANRIPALRSFLSSTPVAELSVDAAADEQEIEDIRIDMYTKKAARLSDTEHLLPLRNGAERERHIEGRTNCLLDWSHGDLPFITRVTVPVLHLAQIPHNHTWPTRLVTRPSKGELDVGPLVQRLERILKARCLREPTRDGHQS